MLAVLAALSLGACSFGSEALWPALTGDDAPAETTAQTEEQAPTAPTSADTPAAQTGTQTTPVVTPSQPAAVASTSGLSLGTTNFVMPQVTPGQPTGTFVGQQVEQLRAELVRLQGVVTQRNSSLQTLRTRAIETANRYHGTMAVISARLQTGTTPGNPILVNQWNGAQTDLERVAGEIGFLQQLANEVAADSAMSQFLLEKAQSSKSLQGAVDQDHVQIDVLQDETNKTVVVIERLLTELSDDIRRQTAYVASERGNLQTMALAITRGELYGASLANRAQDATALQQASAVQPTQQRTNQPLVVIQFDSADVAYEQALYTALASALERRPEARFDVVSVAPGAGDAANMAIAAQNTRRYADQVMRSLSNMGLPTSRVALSSTTDRNSVVPEVRVFVR